MHFRLVVFIIVAGFSGSSFATLESAKLACAKLQTIEYTAAETERISVQCDLPARTKNALPEQYWLRDSDYQDFLLSHPTVPQATATQGYDDAHVSEILNHPRTCQFYSRISPSVESGRVQAGGMVRIVLDGADLLDQCRSMAKTTPGLCSAIELAGHSTQAVGLDTVLSLEDSHPALLMQLGQCFRHILAASASPLVLTTCGAERDASGILHYWRGKAEAQQKLSDLLGIPLISGIGPVRFSEEFGANGAVALGGWTKTTPQRRAR